MNWCVLPGIFTDCRNSCSSSRSRCQEIDILEQWFFSDTPGAGGLHGFWRAGLANQTFFVDELMCLTSDLQRFSILAVILEISLSKISHFRTVILLRFSWRRWSWRLVTGRIAKPSVFHRWIDTFDLRFTAIFETHGDSRDLVVKKLTLRKPGFGWRGPNSRSEYERNPTARPGLVQWNMN